MTPFSHMTGIACPLALQNVDTDQIIPARFMKRSRDEGYGGQLLHDMRFAPTGLPIADFPLNEPRYAGAQILVARRNFGSGSSREAAVYALADYGIRCVIAPSFGDIFAANAVNNGLLPAQVTEAEAEALLSLLADPASGAVTVDLALQIITAGGASFDFAIDPVRRMRLLNGWDELDLTLRHQDAIAAFQRTDIAARPWAAVLPAPSVTPP